MLYVGHMEVEVQTDRTTFQGIFDRKMTFLRSIYAQLPDGKVKQSTIFDDYKSLQNEHQLHCSERDTKELMSALASPFILTQNVILLYKDPFVDS